MHRQHEKLTIESQGGGHEEVAASLQITQTGKQLRRMKPALQRKVASSLASSVFACISLAFHQVPNTIVTFFPARWKNFTIVRAGLTHTRSRDRRRGERVRSTPARGETVRGPAVLALSSRATARRERPRRGPPGWPVARGSARGSMDGRLERNSTGSTGKASTLRHNFDRSPSTAASTAPRPSTEPRHVDSRRA